MMTKKSINRREIIKSLSVVGVGASGVTGTAQGFRNELHSTTDSTSLTQGVMFTQKKKLSPDNVGPEQSFGKSLALSGDGTVAMVGADGQKESGSPDSVYFYLKDNNMDSWAKQTTLTGPGNTPDDSFGEGVSLSNDGSKALVGARFDDEGLVYVYERLC